ncbi:MAG: anthranilate synthase component I family protein [Verrucomicrobiae bacterium]
MNRIADQKIGPIAAARAMRSRHGLVFLDSASQGNARISLLAAEPDLVVSGTDWDQLEQELARRKMAGCPDGAAIGCVAFDGTFHFGFYDRPHVFLPGSGRWKNPPKEYDFFPEDARTALDFRSRVERTDFLAMVVAAQEYIASGDIYQVCLSHPFEAPADQPGAWRFFERLRQCSPAPYSAFLDFAEFRVASASPECFLRMSGRAISTSPIKGTRPRRSSPSHDELSAQDLVTSPKEIAELVMITDLERNDLGQVCEFGSVKVTELLRLERYRQVFHLVSTVEGKLREEVSHVRALRECFPGGSISGAPKKRAIEVLRELEPFPRGLYTGAIGYFGYHGESQFSIAIRTAIFEPGRTSFHAGAGIVTDSLPEHEWQETLDKASGLLLAAAKY